MSDPRKTAVVTGASQGIGAGLVARFVERGFNVVATSRKVSQSTEVAPSDRVALVDGHIGEPAKAWAACSRASGEVNTMYSFGRNPQAPRGELSRARRYCG